MTGGNDGNNFYATGDINIALDQCVPEGFDVLWTTENGNIVGQNNSLTITVDEPGDYTLNVINCIGCDATATFTLDNCTQGNAANTSSAAYTRNVSGMFPVPATTGGNLTIQIEDNIEELRSIGAINLANVPNSEEVFVSIYNVNGRMIQTPQKFDIQTGKQAINMQINQLSAGTYFVIINGSGWKDSKQIIIR